MTATLGVTACCPARDLARAPIVLLAILRQVETSLRHGGVCKRCGALARLLVVTPCAHLLCIDCARTSRWRSAIPSCTLQQLPASIWTTHYWWAVTTQLP